MLHQVVATLLEAANFALVVLGVAWAFRVVRFPDLSGEGTFVLGAFLSASVCGAGFGGGAMIGLLAASIGGAVAGLLCAILNSRLKIPNLLCGILVAVGLYSANMVLLGKPNAAVDAASGVFAFAFRLEAVARDLLLTLSIFGIFCVVAAALVIALRTSVGIRLKAATSNPSAAERLGLSPERSQLAGLALANAIVALGGALFAQRAGFVSIQIGYGIVIQALAAVLLGEAVLGRSYRMISIATTALTGSILYSSCCGKARKQQEC